MSTPLSYYFVGAIPSAVAGGAFGALTQAASSLTAPSGGSAGVLTREAWVVANGYSPTDVYVHFTGAAQTVTNGLLWGYDGTNWYQYFVFDTPLTIVGAAQGVSRRVTGAGVYTRLAVSGTASVGNVTVDFVGAGLRG